MTLSVGQIEALTLKGIVSEGGVKDAVFKNHPYLKRLREKEGVYTGSKLTIPFMYMDDTSTPGKFYSGAASLSLQSYDPITELSFDMKEIYEPLLITHGDLAKNSGREARINLVDARLKQVEMALKQRFVKGVYSDGTVATGAQSADQFPGMAAFLKNSSVNYGGITDSDVSVHCSYVNSNSGTNRALTKDLIQATIGGASEGMERPSLGIMRQNVMDQMISLIAPHQRTVKSNSLNGLGHDSDVLFYNGIDHIVDNLCIANAISYINEKFVKLYSSPEYNMKTVKIENLQEVDAMLTRIHWKGVYACQVLRFQGILKDIAVA